MFLICAAEAKLTICAAEAKLTICAAEAKLTVLVSCKFLNIVFLIIFVSVSPLNHCFFYFFLF